MLLKGSQGNPTQTKLNAKSLGCAPHQQHHINMSQKMSTTITILSFLATSYIGAAFCSTGLLVLYALSYWWISLSEAVQCYASFWAWTSCCINSQVVDYARRHNPPWRYCNYITMTVTGYMWKGATIKTTLLKKTSYMPLLMFIIFLG